MKIWICRVLIRLKPVEYVVLLYIFITSVLLLLFSDRLDDEFIHVLIRLAIILVMVTLNAWTWKSGVMRFLKKFYPLVLLGFFYSETDYFNNLFLDYMDPFFARMEQSLTGMQPSLKFSQIIPFRWFSELMYFGYFAYYLMIFGLPLYLYLKKNSLVDRVMFQIVSGFIFYYIIFIFLPVAGPQFYFPPPSNKVPEGYLITAIVRFIQETAENPTGAFPSSHAAMAVILCIISFRYAKGIFYVLTGITVLLLLSTVYIKAHYLVDVIAGIATAPFVYLFTDKIYKFPILLSDCDSFVLD